MSKIVTAISLATLLSLPVKATEPDVMIEMMINMMEQSGELSSMSSCLGITPEKFIESYNKTLEICIPHDALEGDCMTTRAPKLFGIAEDKFAACTADDDEEDEIDYAKLSDVEIRALMQKQRADALEKVDEMMALVKKSSQGTEDEITLPVFSPSSIVSHFVNGMQNSSGETTLPVATFSTDESVEKVFAFYRDSLPKFETSKNEGIYMLMEKVPSDLLALSFDLEALPLYFMPHIEIYSLNISGQERTSIVISYKPR